MAGSRDNSVYRQAVSQAYNPEDNLAGRDNSVHHRGASLECNQVEVILGRRPAEALLLRQEGSLRLHREDLRRLHLLKRVFGRRFDLYLLDNQRGIKNLLYVGDF